MWECRKLQFNRMSGLSTELIAKGKLATVKRFDSDVSLETNPLIHFNCFAWLPLILDIKAIIFMDYV